ncbi:PKD domain-containing protein [Cognataquiflexum rubidum]|uniref:PKD domain-containing protein n=1 Tax=Cognataquiflexum rubidum TaxID=2922273 RepID=UPI001F13D8DB|nr:PKD domain-containing protein [Cognataquiflexum rubidum]MCH6234187.1 PKD domain-containing protein [Cognataquiflexum rubidum]
MKSTRPFFLKMDTRVFLFMGIISMFFIIVLSLRFKQYQPCIGPTISTKKDKLYAGDIIQFKTQENEKGTNLEWDFGDNSPITKLGSAVSHVYQNPGRYQISVKISDNCMAFSTVIIENHPPVVNEKLQANFSGPETIEVGKPANFIDHTENATTWEWRFGESNKVDATSQKPKYTFKKAGTKKIILTVNGNITGEKIILVTEKAIVKPKPKNEPVAREKPSLKIEHPSVAKIEKPSDVEKTPETISVTKTADDEEINEFLKQLATQGQSVISLSKYFCDPKKLKFFFKNESIKEAQLDKELKKVMKSGKIQNLKIQTNRSGENNCVNVLQITLDK